MRRAHEAYGRRVQLRDLAWLVAIADHQHVSAAADGLGVSQPTLSRALARCEAELGARLFERVPDGVRTTPAGALAVDGPALFLQGTRDELASLDLLQPLLQRLGAAATLVLLDDADHSFHVRARSGQTDAQVLGRMLDATVGWMRAALRR